MKNKHLLLIAIFGLVSFQFILAQQFEPVWETPFNPMNIYVTGATYNGEALGTGDEIGIFDLDESDNEFCVGSIVLQGPILSGEFAQIICSMDDGINQAQPNGFYAGHEFVFKFRINQSVIEAVEFSFPYPDYDETFTPLGTAIVNLSSIPQNQTQTVQLTSGWNSLSSFIIPENTNLELLLNQISDEFIILQNLTEAYYPTGSINSLEVWNNKSGYFIKVLNQTELLFSGTMSEDRTVNLLTGWNLLPVLSDQEVDIISLFAENLSELEIIKEAVGLKMFWLENDIETLETLLPGKAYLIKANTAFTVTF